MKSNSSNPRKKVFIIDLTGVRSAVRMHAAIAGALSLPEHYGRNLDAMYDVLTEYGGEWKIVFMNSAHVPESFRQVCMDAAAETPGLEIVFV